ncbi:serine/threonine-protein kinase [Simiduia agarivorans]|uniref:Serine/threonine kinase protein n=1 Tax=Simiduia agarivorans (strain DSM 21679 / JCM 13881 / BCRC 17597 / SA1) TaxID=1117647 RepID=K4KZ77_SIMAS|nr:serine/threonine-protein kinase [Simiduia agarivorans]AFU99212.1 serine/threonine kinase protein [Simiduia agarivorans SA1 = DSM 21679]
MTEAEIPQTENYTVEAILGKGGMGVVYLAFDKRLNRKVAIKCIRHNRANENWVEAVTEEARLLAQINHRNIVHIYDLIDWQGSPALVMEYLQGRTLLDIFRSDELMSGELDLATRLDWLRQIAEGLACAHAKGIIHRDLKAENIMITDEGTVKIMDFGIARHQAQPLHANIHDSQVLPGEFIGSPAALSPEQAMGDRLTTASDIFSFGILAYCLLCGHHPFGDPKNADLVLQGIIYRPPMPVQFLECLGIPDEDAQTLGAEIIACLNKAPGMRPAASALAFTQTIPNKEDYTAMPVPPQNSRGLALTISAILVTATAGLIWLAGQQPEPRRNVYVALPTFTGTDMAEYITEATPEFLRNGIIDALLIDDRHAVIQYDNASKLEEPSQLGLASGANEVLKLTFECKKYWCDGRMARYSGPEWHKTSGDAFSIDLRNGSDSFSAVQWHTVKSGLILNDRHIDNARDPSREYFSLLTEFRKTRYLSGESIKILIDEILTYPSFTPNYHLLVKVATRNFQINNNSGDLKIALELIESNKAELPTSTYLKLIGQCQSALKFYREAEASAEKLLQFGSVFDARLIEADLAIEQGNYQHALDTYTSLIDYAPSENGFYGIAYSAYILGDIALTKRALNSALTLNPNSIPANSLLGSLQLSDGEYTSAIENFNKIVEIIPDEPTLNNLATAYLLSGNRAEAKKQFEKAAQLAPNNPTILYNLGELELLAGNQNNAQIFFEKAIKGLRSLEQSSDASIAIRALSLLGRTEEAKNVLTTTEKNFSGIPDYLFSEAIYYTTIGQPDLAQEKIEMLIALGYTKDWFRFPWYGADCNKAINAQNDHLCSAPINLEGDE